MVAEGGASTAHLGDGKTKKRQRVHKTPPSLVVPNINDDAAERKRVLNVLAQRRYRERRRERKAGVEVAQGLALTPERSSPGDENTTGSSERSSLQFVNGQDIALSEPELVDGPNIGTMISELGPILDFGPHTPRPTDMFSPSGTSLLNHPSGSEEYPSCHASGISNATSGSHSLCNTGVDLQCSSTIDPSTLLDPSMYSTASSSFSSASEKLSFPDSYHLPVNELTLLRGLLRVAGRIKCTASIWDLAAKSPFNDGTHTASSTRELPKTWQPTASQLSVPHHPVIDLLPWPSVRDRIIMILSLPNEARPPGAAGPLALVQLAYDLEDSAEGVRIWGGDPCDPTSWEVGQVLFERWWFVFDRGVVDQSNYWRGMRGAAALTMEPVA